MTEEPAEVEYCLDDGMDHSGIRIVMKEHWNPAEFCLPILQMRQSVLFQRPIFYYFFIPLIQEFPDFSFSYFHSLLLWLLFFSRIVFVSTNQY